VTSRLEMKCKGYYSRRRTCRFQAQVPRSARVRVVCFGAVRAGDPACNSECRQRFCKFRQVSIRACCRSLQQLTFFRLLIRSLRATRGWCKFLADHCSPFLHQNSLVTMSQPLSIGGAPIPISRWVLARGMRPHEARTAA